MRWTRQGTHYLLQVRVKVLNEDLHAHFQACYTQSEVQKQVA